jgi:hypothetical protein
MVNGVYGEGNTGWWGLQAKNVYDYGAFKFAMT